MTVLGFTFMTLGILVPVVCLFSIPLWPGEVSS